MKSGILAIGAIGCAVWLTMATEPITVVAGHSDLKPVTVKAEVAEAVKGGCSVVEPRGAIFNDYMNYLAADFENAAERAIDGRRSNADEGTRTDDTGTAEQYTASESVPESANPPVDADQPEPVQDSGTAEAYESALTYIGDFVVTFYDLCPECTGPWYGMNTTASGRDPVPWYTVAAGPSLPFGTVIYIEGFGTFEVMDRGVADGCIDILVNNHGEIPGYGMTTASVYLEV